ncbi:neural cell adhesion molecule 2-like isoform X2 [Lineus longissimus]|uniref:neural cell adhesion molecule 2-like isoform X2 n=1 Tax=Lineus longissimus TaxID=88925 RepID=UPI00315DCE58
MAFILRTCAVWSFIVLISGINGQEPTWINEPTDESVLLGQNVTINCTVANRGSLLTVWTRTIQGASTSLFIDNTSMSQESQYSVIGKFNLHVTGATEADTGTYTCQVGKKLTGTAILNVLVAPGAPSISTQPSSNLKEGGTVELDCISNGGNPQPTIQWFRQGVEIASTTTKTGTSTKGTLQRTLTYDDDGAVFLCKVFNEVNKDKPLETQTVLDVQFQPRVSFRPYNPLVALEGASSYIECVVTANPKETLVSWKKGTADKGANYNLTFVSVAKSDAGNYTCEATNSIGTGRDTIDMQVQYPPIVSFANPGQTFREKEKVTLTCTIDSNPAATTNQIVWNELKTNTRKSLGRTLDFGLIDRSDAGRYSCNVTNSLQPSGQNLTEGQGSAVMDVVVQYQPGAGSIAETGQIKTGDKTTLRCTTLVSGLPAAQFRWTLKDGSTVDNAGVYEIPNTKLSDAGKYKCMPFNTIGDGPTAEIDLEVVETPQFLKTLSQDHQANEGTADYSVNCQARGKPAPAINWFKDGRDISRESTLYSFTASIGNVGTEGSKNVTSILIFKGSARPDGNRLIIADAGNYTCKASSDISSVSSWGVLVVNYAPRMEILTTKIGTVPNETVVMTCACNAVPKPTFSWYLATTKLNDDGIKVKISETNPRPGYLYVSRLTLTTIAEADFGIYYCKANNALRPDNQTEFNLTKKSVPEEPAGLVYLAATWESVELKWEPGFNGGHPQNFVVQYDGKEIETSPSVNTFNVTGLYPNRTYTFKVLGKNALGRGLVSDPVTVTTKTVTLAKPKDVNFSKKDNIVHYTASGSDYCVKVDISSDGKKWINYQKCAPVQDNIKIEKQDFVVNHVNLTLCLQHRQDICGEPPVKAKICEDVSSMGVCPGRVESEDTVPTETIIIVACVCGAVVLILLIILLVLCCRRTKADKEFPEAAHRRPNPVPVTGSKRGRRPPSSGIDNPALDMLDGDMDDPTSGDKHPTPRMNGGPLNPYAHHNGRFPSEPPPSYEMNSFRDPKEPFTITITHPEGFDSIEKPPLQLNSDSSSDKPYLDTHHPNGSLKMDDSRSHNESGYSTPDPTKPKKVIYEVIV